MTTTIEVSCYPNPAQVGGGVTIIASLDPTPPDGAYVVWIHFDSVSSLQLDVVKGQASTNFYGLSAGGNVWADFATVDGSGVPPESGSTPSPPYYLYVLPAPVAGPLTPPTGGWTPDPSQIDVQSPLPSDAGMQTGSNAFNGVSNVDPFTGAPATDPFTGEPLSARDASISDRIKAVYSQSVSQSTRNAIFDFYAKPAIDLTGVPQSVQNYIFDIFSQVPDAPLPGRGLDEFLSDTISSVLGEQISRFGSAVGTIADATSRFGVAALDAVDRAMRPIHGLGRAIGGALEIDVGVAAVFATKGLAVVPGLITIGHGADELVAGVRTMIGEDVQSLSEHLITKALPAGPTAARDAAMLNRLIPLVSGSFGGLLTEAAVARSELSDSTLARGLLTEAAVARSELSDSTLARGLLTEEAAVARSELSDSTQLGWEARAGGSRSLLMVGAENEAEFSWLAAQGRTGWQATAVNPLRTPAATAFETSGGTFVEGGVEGVGEPFSWVHESFPQPLGRTLAALEAYQARLNTLAPGGRLTVFSENQELIEMYQSLSSAPGSSLSFAESLFTPAHAQSALLPPATSSFVAPGSRVWLFEILRGL